MTRPIHLAFQIHDTSSILYAVCCTALHMAAKKTTLKELGDMLAHVVKHMATKDDIKYMATKDDVRAMVRDELKPIHSDLKSIHDELDDLTEKLENVSGFRKEIDYALGRIAAIEKHLGINNKISA